MGKKGFAFDGLLSRAEEQLEKHEEVEKDTIVYIKRNIVIYEEFKYLVPPLTPDELHKLEISIKEEGCRDPLVVWHRPAAEEQEEEWVLVDGHNRYQICEQNTIAYHVVSMEFPDQETAVHWIVNNQLGKRNATEETKSYLRGMQYNREKRKEVNWQNLRQYAGTEHEGTATTGNTADRLAELHKVSEKTIKRDEKFALAIDTLCGKNRELKANVLQKNVNVPKLKLIELAEDKNNLLPELGEELTNGLSFSQAYQKVYNIEMTEIIDYEQYSRDKVLKGIKTSIIQSLDTALKTGDKSHITTLRKYLEELENTL
jgi:ParB-like chromosome segregation protein Spo0J